MSNSRHDEYMRLAIAEANKVPNFPFGAVIVHRHSGQVMAKGHNQVNDSPTFHGEIVTINRCASLHPATDWTELDLYTTAEPCPMCQSAIEWSGINNVYFGTSIPFLIELNWKQILIRAEDVSKKTPFRATTVTGGILEHECNRLFEKINHPQ